ncbi:MAG: glycosyltransferase family 4 protein [Minisyncoccota bacterium]
MNILVITQTIDDNNTTLGFFVRWVEELSKRFDFVEIICLYKGEYVLPDNVKIYSLGKERGVEIGGKRYEIRKKIQYVFKFYKYIWKYRNEYDAVFVHMNQEYIVLGGLFWKIFGKRVFFWRNHPYGNIWTRIAVWFSDQVFCTADRSFTAKYKKTIIMPAGIDTSIFVKNPMIEKQENSLLVFGRIAPVKNIEKAINATAILLAKGVPVELSIVGDFLPIDAKYMEGLKNLVIQARIEPFVHFIRGIDFLSASKMYQSHDVFMNFTDSGSFDKTVIEALACGSKVLVSNTSFKDLLPEESYTTGDQHDIVKKLEVLLSFDIEKEKQYASKVHDLVENQSLVKLMDQLVLIIKKP